MSKKGWDKNIYLAANTNARSNGQLFLIVTTEVQLQHRFDKDPRIMVAGKLIDISSPLSLVLGVNIEDLLEGGIPAALTQYNVYLSSLGVLGVSATAYDSSGYRVNDVENLHVGIIYLDANKECSSFRCLCGYGEQYGTYKPTSNIVKTSGLTGTYDLFTLDNILMLPGVIKVYTHWSFKASARLMLTAYLQEGSVVLDRTNVGLYANSSTFKNRFDTVNVYSCLGIKNLKLKTLWSYSSGANQTFVCDYGDDMKFKIYRSC